MKKRYAVLVLISLAIALLIVYFLLSNYSKEVDVEIRDDAPWFFPATLEIEPGTTVTWNLKSPAVHPIMTLERPENAEEIHSGHFTETWSYKFSNPGIYVYICPIHPYMKGVIGVGEKIPEDKIPSWVKEWPPKDKNPPEGLPEIKGKGEIWLGAQFHKLEGKEKPGTIIIIDAENWEIEKILGDEELNNPHNLWAVDDKVVVANWFDLYVSVFDKKSKNLEKHIWVGESPAHVHSHDANKTYVTLQGDGAIAVLDENFEITKKLRAPKGPHGHWISKDGKLMSLASTEMGKISLWDTEKDSIVFEEFVGEKTGANDHPHSLPLFAGITLDGKYIFATTSNEGKFYVFDVEGKKLVKSLDIGPVPVQAIPSPDEKYVLVPIAGTGEVVVISIENWEIVKRIPNVGSGAHGVYYGKNEDNELYAYVTSKFERWVSVIDLKKLEVAGYIPLPEGAFGGQGILVIEDE